MLQHKTKEKERKDSGNLHNSQHLVIPSDVANVRAQEFAAQSFKQRKK